MPRRDKFALLTGILAMVASVMGTGCDRVDPGDIWNSTVKYLEENRFIDSDPLPQETIDVLCDASDGSTCTEASLKKTLEVVLGRAKERPGSRVRLWNLSSSVAFCEMLYEAESPPESTEQLENDASPSWSSSELVGFLKVAEKIWLAPHPRRSPLAEAISKIALTEGYDKPRSLIVVTDGREYRLGDFECRIPSKKYWAALLKNHSALLPGSLKNFQVAFTFMSLPPIKRRCATSLTREAGVRERWTEAFAVGGADFAITTGAVVFGELQEESRDSDVKAEVNDD